MAETPKIGNDLEALESESIAVCEESNVRLTELSSEVMDAELSAVFPDFEADDFYEPDVIESLKAKDVSINRQATQERREETEMSDSMFERLRILKADNLPLKESLAALRAEFKGKIDKETDAVLAQFEALFSPDLITDEKERKAVENLFFAQGVSSFTPVVFTGFLNTIYEQPDDVISTETKERIRDRFKKPKQRIETADQLRREAFRKDENGELEYNSPDNALELENGMSVYAQPNGQMAVSYASTGEGEIQWTIIKIHKTWSSEHSAKRINYLILHREIYNQLDGLSGLFGGKRIDDDWPEEERDEAAEKSARFIRCFVGPAMEPHQSLQLEHMQVLRASLRALVNPLNISKADNVNDLRELGVMTGTELNWNRLEAIGEILRQNRYFKAQAIKNPALPNQLLKAELAKRDQQTHLE